MAAPILKKSTGRFVTGGETQQLTRFVRQAAGGGSSGSVSKRHSKDYRISADDCHAIIEWTVGSGTVVQAERTRKTKPEASSVKAFHERLFQAVDHAADFFHAIK